MLPVSEQNYVKYMYSVSQFGCYCINKKKISLSPSGPEGEREREREREIMRESVSSICLQFLSHRTGHFEHALLLFLSSGQVHLLNSVWSPTESGGATHERQILELCLLQVHLCVWSDECSRDAGDALLVCLVCCSGDSVAHRAALQGQISICESMLILRFCHLVYIL